jgi:hypothetical protein
MPLVAMPSDTKVFIILLTLRFSLLAMIFNLVRRSMPNRMLNDFSLASLLPLEGFAFFMATDNT